MFHCTFFFGYRKTDILKFANYLPFFFYASPLQFIHFALYFSSPGAVAVLYLFINFIYNVGSLIPYVS